MEKYRVLKIIACILVAISAFFTVSELITNFFLLIWTYSIRYQGQMTGGESYFYFMALPMLFLCLGFVLCLTHKNRVAHVAGLGLTVAGFAFAFAFRMIYISVQMGDFLNVLLYVGVFHFVPYVIIDIIYLCLAESEKQKEDALDMVLKYKTLEEKGIITEEEFNNKRNELLH